MSELGIDKEVVPGIEENPLLRSWTPFDFGFYVDAARDTVYHKMNYELRDKGNGLWLLRKRRKNEKGNSEMLVAFYGFIPEKDFEYAQKLLQLYLVRRVVEPE